MTPSSRSAILGIAAFAVLSFVAVQTPGQQQQNTAVNQPDGTTFDPSNPVDPSRPQDPNDPGNLPGNTPTGGTSARPLPSNLECKAGRNGGATDVGVFANRIRVASTHVLSGIGSSFLGSSHIGMQAVVSKVNSTGGICGRLIELTLRDDEWSAARGADFIANFVKDRTGYFALPVVPSSEGLTQAIKNRTIDGSRVPVIGTDGMLKEQYLSANVWPVATATVSTMRAMAKYAYERLGARKFGIVYDNQYKFGVEGATAYRSYVESLSGADVVAYVGIQPGQPSYTETETFNDFCGATKRCEFVAMLLEPGTALAWVNSQGNDDQGRKLGFGSKGTGGAQPLFNERFARDCGPPCAGMTLWTGYNPPIGALKNLRGVAQYSADVKAISRGVDVNNQFLEGAYLGMQVFVEALRKVGPGLTRDRLRAAMDTMTYRSDLASTLVWSPGRHYANSAAHAFSIVTAAGGFAGFRDAQTGFISDPQPGNFPR